MLLCLLCVALCASKVLSTCWTPRNEDIDWDRLPSPWYDVIDVPEPAQPPGCWATVNFTKTDTGIMLTLADYTVGESATQTTDMYFIRSKPGVYLMTGQNVENMKDAYNHLTEKSILSEKEEKQLNEEIPYFTQSEWTFITDYENYFFIVQCGDPDWIAFVKARTPHITVDQLQTISQALVDNGLQSPTMTLKNGCLNTGGKEWSEADVVIQ